MPAMDNPGSASHMFCFSNNSFLFDQNKKIPSAELDRKSSALLHGKIVPPLLGDPGVLPTTLTFSVELRGVQVRRSISNPYIFSGLKTSLEEGTLLCLHNQREEGKFASPLRLDHPLRTEQPLEYLPRQELSGNHQIV